MNGVPARLCRYRSLDESLFRREMDALKDSYLYAPSFRKMNDPMEGFYQLGGNEDYFLKTWLGAEDEYRKLHKMASDIFDRLAIISLSQTTLDYPLWAYYASSFSGMCLEFDTSILQVGGLQGENLVKVVYQSEELPALGLMRFASESGREELVKRISIKREEWVHEKEWRFVVGEEGKRYYRDDAIKRVLLGPKIDPRFESEILELLSNRPVQVLKGSIEGMSMHFDVIQDACELEKCERVGEGAFEPENDLYGEEIKEFLKVPFERLVEKCKEISRLPNMDSFGGVGVSKERRLFLWTSYRLRSGTSAYERVYFDEYLNPLG